MNQPGALNLLGKDPFGEMLVCSPVSNPRNRSCFSTSMIFITVPACTLNRNEPWRS